MISTSKTMHLVLAALLASASICASAQTAFSTSARFVAVDATQPASMANLRANSASADPDIFANLALTGAGGASYAGAVVDLGGSPPPSPQAQITGVTLYAYALKMAAYQHVSARFRFWNAYQQSASLVFSKPVEFVADIASCPCNFIAGNVYGINIVLPKSVYTEGTQGFGFSQAWEVGASDSILATSSDLVPALDSSGGAASVGSNVSAYANYGTSTNDLNFAPFDQLTGKSLALELQGKSLTLDQCTGAANFQDQFSEEFDDASVFFQRWKMNSNSSIPPAVGSGYLALSAPDGSVQFPYVASGAQATMIPPTGNFEVRWRAVYTQVGTQGDGEMVLSAGTPLYGDPAGNTTLSSWQDSNGFYITADTSNGQKPVAGVFGTTVHDMEYCWVNGNVELWKDGQKILAPTAQPAQRPDSIWFGNPDKAGTSGGTWNAVTIYRVLVRGDQAAIVDHIFSDGFEPPPVHQ